ATAATRTQMWFGPKPSQSWSLSRSTRSSREATGLRPVQGRFICATLAWASRTRSSPLMWPGHEIVATGMHRARALDVDGGPGALANFDVKARSRVARPAPERRFDPRDHGRPLAR